MYKLFIIFWVVVIIAGIMYLIQYGWNKNEVVECQQWLKQSNEFTKWYSTDWQRAQCEAHKIELPKNYQPN